MRKDWTYCDGTGSLERESPNSHRDFESPDSNLQRPAPNSRQFVSRRSALALGSIGLLSFLTSRRSALAQAAFSKDAEDRDLLVVVFLRGGADGLNIVVPHGEDAYHRIRPGLRLANPGSSSSKAEQAIDLDGFFGFHPALAPLLPHYREGSLGILHGVGSDDHTRSHFEAMSAMERGLPNATAGAASGWLARYLTETQSSADSPLRAVALGSILPDSLRGGSSGSAIQSLTDYRIAGDAERTKRFEQLLRLAYSGESDEARKAGQDTLNILDSLSRLDPQAYKAGAYPASDLGEGLKQVAMLAKAEVGLEVACLDKGGWDTHVAQGVATGWLAGLLDDVAKSLAAFTSDMGERMKRTTILVMTEFGRRAYENTGLGTDHGRASMMLLLGGGIAGGRVHGQWPGLEEHQLEDGDLRVTTDYRQVLAEVLQRRMRFEHPERLFDNLSLRSPGVCS